MPFEKHDLETVWQHGLLDFRKRHRRWIAEVRKFLAIDRGLPRFERRGWIDDACVVTGVQPAFRDGFHIRRCRARQTLETIEVYIGAATVRHALRENVRSPSETAQALHATDEAG